MNLMAIYVTGDIHGDPKRLSTKIFTEQKELTKDDYVIILGDFGLVWNKDGEDRSEKHWLDWLEDKKFTTLFIDGNHENHNRLAEYPVEMWNGGQVHKIRPSVIHLMRGEIFELQGHTFFTFGGASSHDIKDGILEEGDPRIKRWKKDYYKEYRIRNVEWWEAELPSEEEMQHGLENLEKHNNKVDFILTHCGATSTAREIGELLDKSYKPDILTKYLEQIKEKVDYKKWYMGHYHICHLVNEKETVLFEEIEELPTESTAWNE